MTNISQDFIDLPEKVVLCGIIMVSLTPFLAGLSMIGSENRRKETLIIGVTSLNMILKTSK
jgi:hypothetical protein